MHLCITLPSHTIIMCAYDMHKFSLLIFQYHGLFPRRQLWRPTLEYPLWDYNWDGRKPPPIIKKESTEENENGGEKQMSEGQRDRFIRKNGVTRHIIMIRHGQYDETHKVRGTHFISCILMHINFMYLGHHLIANIT